MSLTESNVNEPMNSTPKSSSNLAQETNQSVFKLFVWPGEWDLESLDAECLTAIVIYILISFWRSEISTFSKIEKPPSLEFV